MCPRVSAAPDFSTASISRIRSVSTETYVGQPHWSSTTFSVSRSDSRRIMVATKSLPGWFSITRRAPV